MDRSCERGVARRWRSLWATRWLALAWVGGKPPVVAGVATALALASLPTAAVEATEGVALAASLSPSRRVPASVKLPTVRGESLMVRATT